MSAEQRITFDSSGLDATINYVKHRTEDNFHKLISSGGNDFAYRHYRWSNMDARTTPEEFWVKMLERVVDEEEVIQSVSAVRDYLLSQSKSRWLPGVLDYLPKGHRFDVSVHLNLGYDNIAFGGDVVLNLNHAPFHVDHREVIYYLMHELAHAGYFRYNETPDLEAPKTRGELVDNIKFFTHMEGMGVITPLRLRTMEGGLSDPDYVALGDSVELRRRLHAYFEKLRRLEADPGGVLAREDLGVYNDFSGKPLRLWYVVGCHMAQVIEAEQGSDALGNLIQKGSSAFFDKYRDIYDPLGG